MSVKTPQFRKSWLQVSSVTWVNHLLAVVLYLTDMSEWSRYSQLRQQENKFSNLAGCSTSAWPLDIVPNSTMMYLHFILETWFQIQTHQSWVTTIWVLKCVRVEGVVILHKQSIKTVFKKPKLNKQELFYKTTELHILVPFTSEKLSIFAA